MNRIRIHVLPSSRGRVTQTARVQEHQTCAYTQRPCSQPRLEGWEFCSKHILEDKNAPYRQCSYVSSKNGKRCPNAAPKPEKKDSVAFCAEHAHRNALALQAQIRKTSSGPSPEVLLSQLSGYSKTEAGSLSQDGRSEASRILDEDSWSEEEQDPVVLDQTWRGDPDSEADSIDSDHEDPLKHAGVYTAEEVALITREKLIRLQSLYIDQFKRLQHLLKEKKRRYLHSRKIEHETIGSSLLTGPEGLSMKERENLRKLKALRRYRRRYGAEALLHRQLRERRQAATEGAATQVPSVRPSQRCISFVEGTQCSNRSLPMTRHCVSRILFTVWAVYPLTSEPECVPAFSRVHAHNSPHTLPFSPVRHRALNQDRQLVVAVGFKQWPKSESSWSVDLPKCSKWDKSIQFEETSHAHHVTVTTLHHLLLVSLIMAIDIYQDSNQVLFKMCPGLKDVPCDRPVHMGLSEEPRCPLHLSLPPPMYQPEQDPLGPEPLASVPMDMYLSAAELQPTESLPLEFSDDLDVVGDEGMQCPPSPLLFDTALALEDQTIRAIAEAPMDILTGAEQGELGASAHDHELSDTDDISAADQAVSEVPETAGVEHATRNSSKDPDTITTDATS